MRMLSASVALVLLIAAATATAQQPSARVHGNLNQVMRGILFPNSNILFDTQEQDPANPDKERAGVFASTYGGWQAVENAAVAIGEAANLITLPGRVCENGKPVPIGDPEYQKAVQSLRAVSAQALKAAQAKNRDAMLEVADALTTACAECHDIYRDKVVSGKPAGLAERCTK